MVQKWLHLNFKVGSPWGYLLVRAINSAVELGRITKPTDELCQMPLYIATRLDMLPRIAKRIDQECRLLFEIVKNHDLHHVFKSAHKGNVFNVDEELKFNLMIDIDSLIFEVHSCCEITMRLVSLVYDHIGKSIPKVNIGKTVRSILSNAGLDTMWFVELDNNRNFFIHQGTLYISVDLTKEEDGLYDLLIMKENLHEYTDPQKFIRLSDLTRVFYGFIPAIPAIEKHLASLYS